MRGKEGPLFTSKMNRPAIVEAAIEAGVQMGLEYREDVNDLTRLHKDCIWLVPADARAAASARVPRGPTCARR